MSEFKSPEERIEALENFVKNFEPIIQVHHVTFGVLFGMLRDFNKLTTDIRCDLAKLVLELSGANNQQTIESMEKLMLQFNQFNVRIVKLLADFNSPLPPNDPPQG